MSDLPEEPFGLETDNRFPSGDWMGYFIQFGRRSRMELQLHFENGSMRGEGADWVGHFLVRGRYQTEDGQCWFTKRYIAGHDVAYQGYNEGRGIWGVWEIPQIQARGGFHIWPLGSGDWEAETAEAEMPFEESAQPAAVPLKSR